MSPSGSRRPARGTARAGPPATSTSRPSSTATEQGLKALAAYDFVDRDNIVIFGHSMGGVMAPLIAAEAPVKGIAVYGTVAKTWYEYFGENFRRQAMPWRDGRRRRSTIDQRKDAVLFAAVLRRGRSHPRRSSRRTRA